MKIWRVLIIAFATTMCAEAYFIGERVEAVLDNPDGNPYLRRGDQGRVVCVFASWEYYDTLIEWDRSNVGHSGFGTCSGKAAPGRGWAVKSWMIRSITTTIGPAIPPTPSGSITRSFRSANYTAVFWYPGGWFPVPMVYTWNASLIARYTTAWDSWRGTTMVSLSQLDQSVMMAAAANWNAPCDVELGISTDVLEERWRYAQTVFISRPGSYLFSPGTLLTGGVTDLSLRLSNPRLRAKAIAVARECYGWSSFQWDVDLP